MADYRSELAIFDLTLRQVRTVLRTPDHIEAPNWTPDGEALIVNGGGRLYRVTLGAPDLVPIDTGFARRLNNDHGISPDGRTVVISDATEHGQSAIYTLPIEGGAPTRATRRLPAYWHGWSPDGTRLAYVSKVDGAFQVFTCMLDGTDERQLTFDFAHCDGPDYTPDGAHIWFNGLGEDGMQLWRMRADGSDLTRMTHEPSDNWFPHPSPDGRHVLYLAYAKDTDGHPPDRDVALRLMPAAGGESEHLLDLFGGQGTINVPCWAPDAQAFAFVRYAKN